MYDAYRAGATLSVLATRFGISAGYVSNLFKEAGLQTRRNGPQPRTEPSPHDMYQHYQNGATLNAVAKQFKVSPDYVGSALKAAGLKTRPGGVDPQLGRQRVQAMYEQYSEGATLQRVGADHGQISRERVRQLFKQAGLQTRTRAGTAARKREAKALRVNKHRSLIVQRFRETTHMSAIAAEHDLSIETIREILKADLSPEEYLALRRRTQPKRYTDEDLLDLLRQASRAAAGALTISFYRQYAQQRLTSNGKRWPTPQTYKIRFGSWSGALKAAGVEANTTPPPNRTPTGRGRRLTSQRVWD